MKSITFTNNLSSELMDWMETYAIRNKLTRRAIIKSAERFEKIRSPKGIRRIFQTGILGSGNEKYDRRRHGGLFRAT